MRIFQKNRSKTERGWSAYPYLGQGQLKEVYERIFFYGEGRVVAVRKWYKLECNVYIVLDNSGMYNLLICICFNK